MPKPLLNTPAPGMTQLSPLEETLFKTWARAHGVAEPDHPENFFDYRGLYKQSNGLIHPNGMVPQMAAAHNAGIQPQEGTEINNPDPFMAAAEIHKANLDSESKKRSDMIKMQLEHKKMEHKTSLEQMKLAHKSHEADKDRAHKAQVEQAHRAQAAQDRMVDRHFQMEDAARARQEAMQDAHMNRQNQVQDSVMQEHFARTRPAPTPHSMGPGTPPPHQGGGVGQPSQPQPNTLHAQLMQRALR